jgi:hypothetical protein
MGACPRIVGFAPPDDKWKQMRSVYDACSDAGVAVPSEVLEFFNHEEPSESGIKVELDNHECCKEHKAEMEEGYEVDLRKVPANIQFIRFYVSY